jgi:hypothetical protein
MTHSNDYIFQKSLNFKSRNSRLGRLPSYKYLALPQLSLSLFFLLHVFILRFELTVAILGRKASPGHHGGLTGGESKNCCLR